MISHIHIQNFAIIKELRLDLQPGLNILTGETGAGKSIVIEAMSMALGSRADSSFVRTGCDRATITVIVDAPESIEAFLEDSGISSERPLVLTREISAIGRSICRINGTTVPLSTLSMLGQSAVDIHGQYDHQSLLNASSHIEFVDRYGREAIEPVRTRVAAAFHSARQAKNELQTLLSQLADRERQVDFMRFELQEIRQADLVLGEDEQLEHETRLMQNREHIFETLTETYAELFESDSSALSALGQGHRNLQSIESFDEELRRFYTTIGDAYYSLEDLGHAWRRFLDALEFSPRELEEKIGRLHELETLKRKYQKSIPEIIAYSAEIEHRLDRLEQSDDEIDRLQNAAREHEELFLELAGQLSGLRKKYGAALARDIQRELHDLHFNEATFETNQQIAPPSERGVDRVEFLIAANRGEQPKPLASVASGGEVSRIMLAMKRIIGDLDDIPTMIFDEIDSGISGAAAGIVGEKLRNIAGGRQIVCITHLPQIASFAHHHFRIEKISDEISTHTTISPLDRADRIEEIARLLSGTVVTEQARTNARELLERSGLSASTSTGVPV